MCGFSEIHGQNSISISIHFYIVCMLFLVFESGNIIIISIAVTILKFSLFGFSIALFYLYCF